MFYRSMPGYTLAGPGDSGAGSKVCKDRITLLLCVNGDGSDNSIVAIGRSKVPRKTNVKFWKDNKIKYYNNGTAWMTGYIFKELLTDFDDRLTRKTVLILDNFSGHTIDPLTVYKHLCVVFLPPNTTAVTQALDAGISHIKNIIYRDHCYL